MVNEDYSSFLKEKLLDMLRFTLKFCERNNLRCYGCGGTVLGAVRHKGFIPWDDDIDLYMPRQDYDRLIQMKDELHREGYSFVCIENAPDYYLPFGKIIDIKTSIWELKYYPYMLGNYVDIFPLDYFEESAEWIACKQEEFYRVFQKYQMTLKGKDVVEILSSMKHFNFIRALQQIYYPNKEETKRKLYGELIQYIESSKSQSGSKCVCLPMWRGRVFESSWFDNATMMPFEDLLILVPKDYDSYLTLLYGDYMTPPPIEQRIPAHGEIRYYVNFNEHVSIEEARLRISKGERLVY